MSTDALELALALHQAPEQRQALRERPLPQHVGRVIRLAAGSQPLLAETAQGCGLDEQAVQEAARFFVQQILLEPGTDPYRVLGVGTDATAQQLRTHFHWLQRWLHPDRGNDEWQSEYVTRLNWAWQQLRTEAAREAWDRENRQQREPRQHAAAIQAVHQPLAPGRWTPIPVASGQQASRTPWLRRLAVLTVGATLAGLFYLVLTQPEPAQQSLHEEARADRDAALRDQMPGGTSKSLDQAANGTDSEQLAQVRVPALPLAASPASKGVSHDQRAESADTVEPGLVQTVAVDAASRDALAAKAEDGGGEPSDVALAKSPARLSHASPQPGARPVQPQAKSQTAVPPARHVALAQPPATADRPAGNAKARTHATPNTARQVSRIPQPPRPVIALQVSLTPVPLTHSAPTPVATVAAASASAPLDAEQTLARVTLARQQIRSLVSFLRGAQAPAAAAQGESASDALRCRNALRQRIGVAAAAQFMLDAPSWRAAGDHVDVEADYRVPQGQTLAEKGRFQASMAWHGSGWRLTRLELEPQH